MTRKNEIGINRWAALTSVMEISKDNSIESRVRKLPRKGWGEEYKVIKTNKVAILLPMKVGKKTILEKRVIGIPMKVRKVNVKCGSWRTELFVQLEKFFRDYAIKESNSNPKINFSFYCSDISKVS